MMSQSCLWLTCAYILSICKAFDNQRAFWNADLRTKSDELIHAFRANVTGVQFSGVFSDNSILQRGPQLASVYGISDTSNTKITLSISGNNYNKVLSTQSDRNGEWKITLTEAMSAGGNYNFNVKCDGCKSKTDDTINNIKFGDVFYCSGQSNMDVNLSYVF
eukprot:514827_1